MGQTPQQRLDAELVRLVDVTPRTGTPRRLHAREPVRECEYVAFMATVNSHTGARETSHPRVVIANDGAMAVSWTYQDPITQASPRQ